MTQTPDVAVTMLWPFYDAQDAAAWRQHNPPADQAWHLDAGQTALRFAHDFLGFDEIDQVTSSTVDTAAASVGVGSLGEQGLPMTVAVVRLVRVGGSALDPWQVVGAAGPDLTITTPAVGSSVAAPLAVGGVITGVDESLHVYVRAVGSATPLGEVAGIEAGGESSPWSTSVGYLVPAFGVVLTVAVSTGGHLQRVERFTAVGVVQS